MSTETKVEHTPGPWGECGNGVFVTRLFGNNGYATNFPVATIYDPDDVQQLNDVCRANARLIAAAPEMLEALDELYKLAVHLKIFTSRHKARVETVLAKARGERGAGGEVGNG